MTFSFFSLKRPKILRNISSQVGEGGSQGPKILRNISSQVGEGGGHKGKKIKVSKMAYKGFRSILVSCRKHMENDPTSNMLFADNFLKASYVEIAKNS